MSSVPLVCALRPPPAVATATPANGDMDAPEAISEVYSPDFRKVMEVPRSAILHLPPEKLAVTRLVACGKFSAAIEAAGADARPRDAVWRRGVCPMGRRCKFVHLDRPQGQFPSRDIHVHYLWRTLETVNYRKLWEGDSDDAPQMLLDQCMYCNAEVMRYDEQRVVAQTRIAESQGDIKQHDKDEDERVAFAMMVDLIASVAPAMRIPASRLLYTAGAAELLKQTQEDATPTFRLYPCFQYTCQNECRQGENCDHAHVINIDHSQPTSFMRRTLRHVKAAAEAISQLNGGVFMSKFKPNGDVFISPSSGNSYNPSIQGDEDVAAAGTDIIDGEDGACSESSIVAECASTHGGRSSIAPKPLGGGAKKWSCASDKGLTLAYSELSIKTFGTSSAAAPPLGTGEQRERMFYATTNPVVDGDDGSGDEDGSRDGVDSSAGSIACHIGNFEKIAE